MPGPQGPRRPVAPAGAVIRAGATGFRPLGADWEPVTKGDIGGFGVGSDFAWHVTAFAVWNFFDYATLMLGFRYLDVDYDDGNGAGRFLWDVSESGPAAGLAWRF